MKYLRLFIIIIIIVASQLLSCRKEGLSKDTGNIEITIPYTNRCNFTLYTELQFDNFLNFRPSTIYKELYTDGTSENKGGNTIIRFKGIPGGNYGFHLWWWNTSGTNAREIKKSIVVINKKTVKENLQ